MSISRSVVRRVLGEEGVATRDFTDGHAADMDLARVKRTGATPFGYTYLEGKMVVEPREYRVITEMARARAAGKGLRAIARSLNERRIPTRRGKKWNHEVVKQILERHLSGSLEEN